MKTYKSFHSLIYFNFSKTFIISIVVSMCFLNGQAQNSYHFTQYTFNPTYFNSAFVGIEPHANLSIQYRNQWNGYAPTYDPGTGPSLQYISMIAPIDSKLFSGVGVGFLNSKIADNNDTEVILMVAAKKTFQFGEFHVGIAPSYHTKIMSDQLRPVDENDPSIENSTFLSAKPNVRLGFVFASNSGIQIGIAGENLLTPKFNFDTDAINRSIINYSLFLRKIMSVPRKHLTFAPSLLIRSDFLAYSFDLSFLLKYKNKYWTAISYRRQESINFAAGISLLKNNKLNLGYSFDYIISNQRLKRPTSHEWMIKFNFSDLILGGKKSIKTPRFAY